MPYIFTNGDLQHLRDCPNCGKVIESAKLEFSPIEGTDVMTYKHYDGTACVDLDTTPQTVSE